MQAADVCPGLFTYRFKFLQEMMLLWAFLLVIWLPYVMLEGYWKYPFLSLSSQR